MKKFKLLMGFLSPLIVLVVAVVCIGGIFAAMQQRVSMQNDFLYEKHIGTGTEEDPYLIYSFGMIDEKGCAEAGSFNFYAGKNEDGKNYFSSVNEKDPTKYNYFRQVENIELEATNQTVVKTNLNGYYTAQGRSITVNSLIFGEVGKNNPYAYIKDLNVLTSGALDQSAGLVENLYGKLENITFSGNINNIYQSVSYWGGGSVIAGGLVETAHGGATITKCRNLGSVSAQHLAGGIVAYAEGSESILISYSYNKGNVSTTAGSKGNYVGGLVGRNNANLNIMDSYNVGVLESTSNDKSIGGMVGLNNSATASINRTYSLICGNNSNPLVASGTINGGNNYHYNFSENSATVLGSSNKELNEIQNVNEYLNWNFAESEEELQGGNVWVMAFGTVPMGNSTNSGALYLPHLWYEVENLSGEFSLAYVAVGEVTGSAPQTKTYSKKNATIQIEKNLNNLARNGYEFLGWSTIKDATEPRFTLDVEGNMPTLVGAYSLLEEVSLYPVWKVETYTLFLYPNGGEWQTIPDGFEYVMGSEAIKYEYTVEDSVSFPTEANILRENFKFVGFEIVEIPEGYKAFSGAGEMSVGAVCSGFEKGTRGNITLKASWQGDENVTYRVIYELANKSGTFKDLQGEVERYIFEATAVAGSVFSMENLDLVSLAGRTLKVYDSSKNFEDMEEVTDENLLTEISTHFKEIKSITTDCPENIVGGNGKDIPTIATVQLNRNKYEVSLFSGDNVSSVNAKSETQSASGQTVKITAYYDTNVEIGAELGGTNEFIFNYWQDAYANIYSNVKNFTIEGIDESLNLTAYAIGYYTLKINPNNAYAKLNQDKYNEFIDALKEGDSEANYSVDQNGVITIQNRRITAEQEIPASIGLGNNELYNIYDANGETIATLVGFSDNKNDSALDGEGYNKSLIVGKFNPYGYEITGGGEIVLYAIWDFGDLTTITLDLNNADVSQENQIIEITGVAPNKVKDILGDKIATFDYHVRNGFGFVHWEEAGTQNKYSCDELDEYIVYGDVTFRAVWAGKNIQYKIETKLQNLDGETYTTTGSSYGNADSGSKVYFANIESRIDGFTVSKIAFKDSKNPEEKILKSAGIEAEEFFNFSGNTDQTIIVYYDREIFEIALTEESLGVASVSFINLPEHGVVEQNGTTIKARYETELTISAELEEGYAWKEWIEEEQNQTFKNQEQQIIVYKNLNLVAKTTFKYRIAFSNKEAENDRTGDSYITLDMCKNVEQLPTGVSAENGQGYSFVLDEAFNAEVVSNYDWSKYLYFSLFELKSEFNGCQYQIGWEDADGNPIITWDKNGSIVYNTNANFEPQVANEVVILYPTWSEETYSLEIDYNSNDMADYVAQMVAPFKADENILVKNPNNTGYNFNGFEIAEFNGVGFDKVKTITATNVDEVYDYLITKDTKITALWTTEGTSVTATVKFEIAQTDGTTYETYLHYTGTSLNLANAGLEETNYSLRLQTNAEIDLGELKEWISKKQDYFGTDGAIDYTCEYFLIEDNTRIKYEQNTVNVKANGSLFVVIRFDLKLVSVILELNDHISKVGFNNAYTQTVTKYYIGNTVVPLALADGGYRVAGWEFTYSLVDGSTKTETTDANFTIPSKTIEVIAKPFAEAIEYEITLSDENLLNATMIDGEIVNIGNVLGGEESIYTIENTETLELIGLQKTGYKFVGYSARFSDGKVYSFVDGSKKEIRSGDIITNIAGGSFANIELTAEFIANTYIIIFNENRRNINDSIAITLPTQNKVVFYGEQNVALGEATIDSLTYGFKGWSLDNVNWAGDTIDCEVAGNTEGLCSIWNFHRDEWTVDTSANGEGDTYRITLYAFWVEFPKCIKITGDVDKIQSLNVVTLVGDSNAKWFKRSNENCYEIYLNTGFVVKLEVEMIPGFEAISWTAGEGTNWVWSKNCNYEDPQVTHSITNFEIDVTNWIADENADEANIVFTADMKTYEIAYDFNFGAVGVTGPIVSVQSTVKFSTNVYKSNINPDAERLLTPSEIAESFNPADTEAVKGLVPRGYKFAGWYKSSSCKRGEEIMYLDLDGNWVCNNWMKAENGTIYAKWVVQEFNVTLHWNYEIDGDEVTSQAKVKYNTEVDNWEVPSRVGYVFDGWYKEYSNGEFDTKLTDNKGKSVGVEWTWLDENEFVAYAKWTAEKYVLFADEDNAHNVELQNNVENSSDSIEASVSNYPNEDIEVTFDKTYEINIKPVREGYNFLGWFVKSLSGEYIQITDADGNATASIWNVDLGNSNERSEIFAKWEQTEVNVAVKYFYEELEDNKFTQNGNNAAQVLADNDITDEILVSILAEGETGFYNEIGEEKIEFKFYRKGSEIQNEEAQIAYADGSLVIRVYYYRLRLTLELKVDDVKRVSAISYEIENGLVEEEYLYNPIQKYATIKYGATIELGFTLIDGAEFDCWLDLSTGVKSTDVSDENILVIDKSLSLEAKTHWSVYDIIYRDCEVSNGSYSYANLPYYFTEPDFTKPYRVGYEFQGFAFDVCDEAGCDHKTCEKYYDVTNNSSLFTAKIQLNGEEKEVSINFIADNNGYVQRIEHPSKGALVLRAIWKGVAGIEFRVVIHEQGLDGVYWASPQKSLYTDAGTIISAVDQTICAYENYANDKYTGKIFVFNLSNAWEEESWVQKYYIFAEYEDYNHNKYELKDMFQDPSNPTQDELDNGNKNIEVNGNGSLVLHIFKQRKQIEISVNIEDILGGSIRPFTNISLSAGNGSKLTAYWNTGIENSRVLVYDASKEEQSSINFIGDNYECIGQELKFIIYYGGNYVITINTLDGYDNLVLFKNSLDLDLDIDIADDHIIRDNNHLIYNVIGGYDEAHIKASCIEYTIKFNLNDLSFGEGFGSTLAGCTNSADVTFVADEENGNYIELKINVLSEEVVLGEKFELVRDGYLVAGFTIKEVAETTQNFNGRLAEAGTITDLSGEIGESIYSICAGVFGPKDVTLAVFDIVWEAETYYIKTRLASNSYNEKEFVFDVVYQIDNPLTIFGENSANGREHSNKIANNKKFIGWFNVPQTMVFDETNNITFETLVDKDGLTEDELNEMFSHYLFGLKIITGSDNNIIWNLSNREGTYNTANERESELERYLIENDTKYINNVEDIDELVNLEKGIYAWYMDATYKVNFDLNLDSIFEGATTELAYFEEDEKQIATTLELRWKPNNVESQVFPVVKTLEDWGKVVKWRFTDQKTNEVIEFEVSENNTYAEDISSELRLKIKNQTLYAIYEGKELTVTYDFNLGNETLEQQVYTETNNAVFQPTFKVDGKNLTIENINQILGGNVKYGGISLSYYLLEGFELVVEDGEEAGVTTGDNELYILAEDIGEIKTADDWKAKYMVSGNVTFKAVWKLNAIKVVYHANYASDVDFEGLGLTEEDTTKYFAYSLGSSFEILNYDDTSLGFTHSQSGLFVGWVQANNDGSIPTIPNIEEFEVGNILNKNTAEVIELYAVWKGSIDNPFIISNACEFNYLAGTDCGGESIGYRDYLTSFNYFESETKYYFDFVANINETESKCGSTNCSYQAMVIPNVNNAVIKGYVDENDNEQFDDGESISISKNDTRLFGTIAENSIVNGFDFEIESYTLADNGLLANRLEDSHILNISVVDEVNSTGEALTIDNGNVIASLVSKTILENICNRVNINAVNGGAFKNSGSLFGVVSGTSSLKNISNYGDITTEALGSFGSITARQEIVEGGVIENISNFGDIIIVKNEYDTINFVGGIFGYISSGTGELKGLHNYGKIEITHINDTSAIDVGGLIGMAGGTRTGEIYISESSNTGDIVISQMEKVTTVEVGGFIGEVREGAKVTISESYNTGSIIDNSYSGELTEVSLLGGFVGYATGEVIIENSYVTSKISGETSKDGVSYASGFVGFAENTSVQVKNSYSMADLKGKFNSGIASVNLGALNITNSYYYGTNHKENYLDENLKGKEKSAMQNVSTYNSWNFVDITMLDQRTEKQVWIKTGSSFISTVLKVGGYNGIYKLPRLWWEELPGMGEQISISYDRNNENAVLYSYETTGMGWKLISSLENNNIAVPSNITYNNQTSRIDDTNIYMSGSSNITILGESYVVQGDNQRKFAWYKLDGQDFVGFSVDPNGTKDYVITGDLENFFHSGNLVLYAVWAPMSYTITYEDTRGQENPNPTEYRYEDEIQLQPLNDIAGYEFAYWKNSAGVEQSIIPNGTTGDLTFTAVWTPIEYLVTIDLNTDFNVEVELESDIKLTTYTTINVNSLNQILSITDTASLNSKLGLNLNTNLYKFKYFKMVSISSVGFGANILGTDGNAIEVGNKINGLATGSYGEFKVVAVYTGYAEEPFEIPDAETFNLYADWGLYAKEGYHFIQTANIVVEEKDGLEVATLSNAYVLNGNYNGQGYSITFTNGKNQALFKEIGTKGSLTNLSLDYSSSTYVIDETMEGLVANKLYGTIENVSAKGDILVTGKISYFGNIGYAYEGAKISGFRNYANLTIDSSEASSAYIGGLVGYVYNNKNSSLGFEIKNSLNEGNISITQVRVTSVGGLIGYLNGDSTNTFIIKDCYNSGNISADASNIGGITGELYGSTSIISHSYNTGSISATKVEGCYVAGITGRKGSKTTVEYSYSIGRLDENCNGSGGIFAKGTEHTEKDLYNYILSDEGANIASATPKTLTELQVRSNYDLSWDIRDASVSRGENDTWSWIWAEEVVKLNGELEFLSLPRLWWESLGEAE